MYLVQTHCNVVDNCCGWLVQKIYWKLKPDALVVLGDVSDAGRKSNDAQWDAVVSRFWSVIGPFVKGPLQVVVGNHDVGDHHDHGMQARLPRFAASFPGLDPTCCSRYNWKLIDFISLNAMAMQGDHCSLCSDVEKVVEKHSVLVQQHGQNRSHNNRSGPVLLLHLPLYREDDSACNSLDVPRCAPWHELEGSCLGVMASPPPYILSPLPEISQCGDDHVLIAIPGLLFAFTWVNKKLCFQGWDLLLSPAIFN